MIAEFATRQQQHDNPDDSQLEAHVWGSGLSGVLGLGDTKGRLTPVLLTSDESGSPRKWSQMSFGNELSVAVTPKGEVFTWGNGEVGSLGHGTNNDVMRPKQVMSLLGKKVIQVSCSNHTAVVTSEGHLFTCGGGFYGQLGHGDQIDMDIPTRVEGLLKGHFVSQVACGDRHTVVLTSDGGLWTFGANARGQTGLGTTLGLQNTPKKVEGGLGSKKVVFIAGGNNHTACITEDGSTYTWGLGMDGKLGHGNQNRYSSPQLVKELAGKKAKSVALGECHTLVCSEDGRVYSFGQGTFGQLGHGNREHAYTPTLIEAPLEGKCVVQVACGAGHSMALTHDGRLFTWGKGGIGNSGGNLGHGSNVDYTTPYTVEALNEYKVVKISSFNLHSVALVVDSKQRSYAKKMKAMLNDESCSDIIFLLKDGDRVYANKGLLIAQSEYFRAMFRSNMRESKENEVDVRDCPKDVFLLFLEYIYKGAAEVGINHALELYVVADRYQENDLSSQCLKVIERELSHENAVQLLVDVDGLGLASLKDFIMSYVVSNFGKVLKKEDIESLSHTLRGELLTMMLDRESKSDE